MDDLISRQAAIDAFNRAVQDVGILDADDIETVFEMLSSADVAPVRHSRWSDEMERVDTYHPFAGFETDYYHRCLNCGHRGKGFSWNFCPNCGAKMDAQGEE